MINRNVCLAFVFAASGVFSLPATAADANPWIGKWTLNVSNSRFNPGPAPKSEVIVTTDSGGGRFHSDVTIVGADGNSQHTESTYAYDGENYPVRGGPVGETVSLRQDSRTHALTVTVKIMGKITGTTTSVLAIDGKSFTGTTTATTPDGKAISNVALFNKS